MNLEIRLHVFSPSSSFERKVNCQLYPNSASAPGAKTSRCPLIRKVAGRRNVLDIAVKALALKKVKFENISNVTAQNF